jgi:hypothetical protein
MKKRFRCLKRSNVSLHHVLHVVHICLFGFESTSYVDLDPWPLVPFYHRHLKLVMSQLALVSNAFLEDGAAKFRSKPVPWEVHQFPNE